MPYTPKQRRFFAAVASGKVRRKGSLSRAQARKMLREGKRHGR